MTPKDEPGGSDSDVFAGLPRSRPQRPSARRKQAAAQQGNGPVAKKPPANKAKPAKTAAPKATPRTTATPKPRAKAEKAPIPRSGYATPDPTRPTGGADVVGEAVTALAELARSVLGRLPRP